MNFKRKFRRWQFKRDMKKALVVMWRIDMFMRKDGFPSYQRKQFWRDFFKSPAMRQRIFLDILTEMRKKGGKKK